MKALQYLVFSIFTAFSVNGCLNVLDQEIQNNNQRQHQWAMEAADD